MGKSVTFLRFLNCPRVKKYLLHFTSYNIFLYSTYRRARYHFERFSAQEKSSENDTFQAGGRGKVVSPSLYSKIGWLEDVRP